MQSVPGIDTKALACPCRYASAIWEFINSSRAFKAVGLPTQNSALKLAQYVLDGMTLQQKTGNEYTATTQVLSPHPYSPSEHSPSKIQIATCNAKSLLDTIIFIVATRVVAVYYYTDATQVVGLNPYNTSTFPLQKHMYHQSHCSFLCAMCLDYNQLVHRVYTHKQAHPIPQLLR